MTQYVCVHAGVTSMPSEPEERDPGAHSQLLLKKPQSTIDIHTVDIHTVDIHNIDIHTIDIHNIYNVLSLPLCPPGWGRSLGVCRGRSQTADLLPVDRATHTHTHTHTQH